MNPGRSSSVRSLDDVDPAAGAPSMSKVHIFVSFDTGHDGELYELLLSPPAIPGRFTFASSMDIFGPVTPQTSEAATRCWIAASVPLSREF